MTSNNIKGFINITELLLVLATQLSLCSSLLGKGCTQYLVNNHGLGPTPPVVYKTVRITKVDKPKHFSFRYVDINTNQTGYKSDKHCSTWNNLKVGHVYKINVNESACRITKNALEIK
jgi:hypothetical protein